MILGLKLAQRGFYAIPGNTGRKEVMTRKDTFLGSCPFPAQGVHGDETSLCAQDTMPPQCRPPADPCQMLPAA